MKSDLNCQPNSAFKKDTFWHSLLLLTIGLLCVLAPASASAIAPSPARAWLEFHIDSVEQIHVEICSTDACSTVTKRYESALCGLFRCDQSARPSSFLSQGFGCDERSCALQSSEPELWYRLIVYASGAEYASGVLSLIQFSNDNASWVITIEEERLVLSPMSEQAGFAYSRQPLGSFWGWGPGFFIRWVGSTLVEVLLLFALLKFLGLAETIFPRQLLLFFLWVNLALYGMLALFIGSWHPLVIASSRFWAYASLVFGTVFLVLALRFYRRSVQWASQLVFMGVAAAILAVPGFFVVVISGFSSIDLYFGGVPTWITIALAFTVAILAEAVFLNIAERRIFKPGLALVCTLVTNGISFGFLWGINLL